LLIHVFAKNLRPGSRRSGAFLRYRRCRDRQAGDGGGQLEIRESVVNDDGIRHELCEQIGEGCRQTGQEEKACLSERCSSNCSDMTLGKP